MHANASKIQAWTKSPKRTLTLEKNVGRNVGYALVRKTDKLVDCSKVKVILKYGPYNGMPYYVFTAMVEL